MNRTETEVTEGTLRKIAFITWDSRLEEAILSRWGLQSLLVQKGVRALDLQLHQCLASHHGSRRPVRTNAGNCHRVLGLDMGSALEHNAGNDAAFEIEMFLAIATMTAEDRETFCYKEQELLGMISRSLDSRIFLLNQARSPRSRNPRAKRRSNRTFG